MSHVEVGKSLSEWTISSIAINDLLFRTQPARIQLMQLDSAALH
jgi:hypothetical protein